MARMAKPKTDHPAADSTRTLQDGGEYQAFALEDADDSRHLRYAVVSAVCVHVVLFLLNFGFLKPAVAAATPPQREVFLVEPIRFKPPPPRQQQQIPEPRTLRVPIPDPTPDEPEPIRIELTVEQEIELPESGIIDIPDAPPPMEPEAPIPVGDGVTRPEKIFGPNPHYTEIARRAGIQGVVIVEAIIDKAGNVTSVRVVKPLPMGLDQAAVDAVKRWRFEPATFNGRPVDVYYHLTINFRLQGH